ncbi:S41 family peptidase [Bacteroidota bacterium]
MRRYTTALTAIIIIFITISSCKPDPEVVERDMLNEWIWDNMTEAYLWADDIDQNLYPTEEAPEDFFYSLLLPDDKFSWIVDDYKEQEDKFNNIEYSNGISPYFIRVSGTDNVVIVVEYVAKGSPADQAGIKRGDIITDINGSEITIENYIELFYTEVSTLAFADYINGSLYSNDIEITLTSKVIDQNPVNHYEIISYEDKNIGYIVYTHFTAGEGDKWLDSLDYIFAEFQSSGIDELIVDLRYNPGGSIFMATHIASVLSPAAMPSSNNVFVHFQWNDYLQDYFTRTYGSYSENLVILFEDAPSYNLDLSNIYFLTSSHSASASELLMIGLEPYMDVVKIGESTYGKCYGSITIEDTEEPRRHEWAMQPIVVKYTNADGYTDFLNGIPPDHEVQDYLFLAKPFGDITDPLLAKGLELITGVSPIATKAAARKVGYELLQDPVRDRKSSLSLEKNSLRNR